MSTLFEDYENTFNSPGGRLVNALEIATVMDLLEEPSDKLVLDIGTGTGRVARHLLKLNNDVVGIDISSERLKLATAKHRAELSNKKEKYHVVKADGQYLPFANRTFDVTLSIRTLKYLRNSNQGICEIARVLKSGGTSVLELSNVFGYEAPMLFMLKLLGKKRYAQNMGPTYRLFNIFKMEKTIENLNLATISKTAWHKVPTDLFFKCKDSTILKILFYMEAIMQTVLPYFLFSRGILIKVRSHV